MDGPHAISANAEPAGVIPADPALLRNLLNTLILLQSHLRLVGETGTNTVLATSRFFSFLDQLFATRSMLTVAVARHGFLCDDAFIDRANRNFEKFAHLLYLHGIASFSLTPEVNPQAIHLFLRLVNRRPAETWDEGGISACLRGRQVAGIIVGEMSERLFQFGAADEEAEPPAGAVAVLWEKYALAVSHGLHLAEPDGSGFAPAALAAAVAAALQAGNETQKAAFARHASRFLLSVQHETVRSYRDATLRSLTAFVNELPADLRILFLTNVFNLNLDGDLAEGFVGGLSDQSILDAFKLAALGDSYTPPVLLRLLGKLAANRGLPVPPLAAGEAKTADRNLIADLFRPDRFADYVPERYQSTLLRIVNEDQLPTETQDHLDRLKQTLETADIDAHLGRVLLEIFRRAPEAQHLAGMHVNLRHTLDFYLATDAFRQINELLQTVAAAGEAAESWSSLADHVASEPFVSAVLDAVHRVDRETLEEIAVLVDTLKAPFIVPLFERLERETNRSNRLVYLRWLKQLGDLAAPEAVRRLADERWYVTRNMLLLLREIGDPAVLPEIRRFLVHRHPKVRQEALGTCLFFRDRTAMAHLLREMEQKDAAEALRAVTLAAQADDPLVVAKLLETVQKSSIFDYRFEIRRAAVRSLAAQAPAAALPVFARILDGHDLLHPTLHERLKLEIVASLDRYAAPGAEKLLRRVSQGGSPGVAQLARLQLKKMTDGKR